MLGKLQQNPNDFWRRSIMHNKTWIYHKTPESTKQFKQWDFWGQSISKMAKVTLSANKVMDTVFCDASYMFFVYYLENGKIIKEDYYHGILNCFKHLVRRKKLHLEKKQILFHEKDTCVHICFVAMRKFHQLSYELLPNLL